MKWSLSLRLEEYFKEKAKENKVKAAEIMNSKIGNSTFLQKSAETFENKEVKKIDTRAELAKIAGVSHGTFSKVAWQYSPKSQNGTLVSMVLFQQLHGNS